MGRSGLPTTLVICCPLSAAMPQTTAEACLDFGRRALMPVTWIAAIDRLPLAVRHGGTAATRQSITTDGAPSVALEIPANQSRQELRQRRRKPPGSMRRRSADRCRRSTGGCSSTAASGSSAATDSTTHPAAPAAPHRTAGLAAVRSGASGRWLRQPRRRRASSVACCPGVRRLCRSLARWPCSIWEGREQSPTPRRFADGWSSGSHGRGSGPTRAKWCLPRSRICPH